MATYGVSISEQNAQVEGGSDLTARSMRPVIESNNQTLVMGGIKTRIVGDTNVEIELLGAVSAFHPAIAESNIQVEGNTGYYARWDDPRNNFLNPNISSVAIQMIANSLQRLAEINLQTETLVHS